MATMGKQVNKAGTGRYDGCQFVNSPKTVNEYEQLLHDFDNSDNSNFYNIEDVKNNSLIFYYGLFECKPISLPFIKVKKQKFKNKVLSMDDFNYNLTVRKNKIVKN